MVFARKEGRSHTQKARLRLTTDDSLDPIDTTVVIKWIQPTDLVPQDNTNQTTGSRMLQPRLAVAQTALGESESVAPLYEIQQEILIHFMVSRSEQTAGLVGYTIGKDRRIGIITIQHTMSLLQAVLLLNQLAECTPRDWHNIPTVEGTEYWHVFDKPWDLTEAKLSDRALESPDLKLRIKWLVQIAKALKEYHKHWVVHMDIALHNFLIRDDGNCFCIDFGLSRVVRPNLWASSAHEELKDVFAQAPNIVPKDAAPEARDRESNARHITPAADVYSFGVLMRALLSEQPQAPPVSVSQIPIYVPEVLARLCQWCTRNKDERPTMAELVDVLERLLQTMHTADENGWFERLKQMSKESLRPQSNIVAQPASEPLELPVMDNQGYNADSNPTLDAGYFGEDIP